MSGVEVNLRCGDTVTVTSMPAIGDYRYCEHCDGRRQVIGVPVLIRRPEPVIPLVVLQNMQFAIGDMYLDGDITEHEFCWRWQLACALVHRHLAEVHNIFAP